MNRFFVSILCLLSALCGVFSLSLAQELDISVGEWRAYSGHYRCIKSASDSKHLFTATYGGMFSFDFVENEMKTYSTVQKMSGITPSALYYNSSSQQYFIGYEDGTIDYFSNPDQMNALTDIERSVFYTQKSIYDFTGDKNYLYVAAEFGLVIYDLALMEPKFTITKIGNSLVRSKVGSVTLFNDKIWVVVGDTSLYSAPVNTPNPGEPAIWKKETSAEAFPQGTIRLVTTISDRIYAVVNGKVYQSTAGQWKLLTVPDGTFGGYTLIKAGEKEDELILITPGDVRVVKKDGTSVSFFPVTGYITDVYQKNDVFYVATFYLGMYKVVDNGTQQESFLPAGPLTNDCTAMAAGNGELYIAPLGYDATFVPATSGSGIHYYNKGTIFEDNQGWLNLKEGNGLPSNRANWNYARALYDDETGYAYLGSFGKGLAILKNGKLEAFYDCANSGMSVIDNPCDTSRYENSRVSGIGVDWQKNVWLTLTVAQNPLQVMTPQGVWYNMRKDFVASSSQISGLLVDDYANKWIMVRRGGVVVYNDKNTPENTADDVFVQLSTNPGQGDLPSANVYSLANDKEGDVWIGTDEGVRIMYGNFLYDLSTGKSADVRAPIVEGYPLLRTESITAIAVDGGNRKWLGTNNGVFLVSADGQSVLAHFTVKNSPLFSDLINDIRIDNTTGEVFFATSKGVISFRSGITSGREKCESVVVFPNPVQSGYEGYITINGLSSGSSVKITTISGQLVRELIGEGGAAIWDGTDIQGRKVASGIYLAFAATTSGEKYCVGKFAILK